MTIRPIADVLLELEARDMIPEVTAVARRHQVTLAEMWGPSRAEAYAAARHELWWGLREAGWSYPRIALLAGKDHTTIMHGVWRHEERMAQAVMRELNRGAA